MKTRFSGLVLALLVSLTLAGCGEVQGTDSASLYIYSGVSGSLIDLPVQQPEEVGDAWTDSSDPGQNTPDPGQDVPDASQNASSGKSGEDNRTVDEDGWYSSKEDVALYIHLYDRLPDNYVTKDEAEQAGWSGGNVERYTGEGTAIGGSRFGNREGLLPKAQGRTYTECDIDTVGENSRGARRIVFSNDGLVYYTDDHYESFELLYGQP